SGFGLFCRRLRSGVAQLGPCVRCGPGERPVTFELVPGPPPHASNRGKPELNFQSRPSLPLCPPGAVTFYLLDEATLKQMRVDSGRTGSFPDGYPGSVAGETGVGGGDKMAAALATFGARFDSLSAKALRTVARRGENEVHRRKTVPFALP
ncbi:hypothetical protein chiPu_0024823, partial [Chiloscyllium punctatum]|nr:hypothetical protein [Chiloscyllium punctatum]